MPVYRIGSDAWNRGFGDIADALSEDPSKALHGAYYRQQALKIGMEAHRLERQAKIAADMQQMFTTDGPFAIMNDPAKFHAYSGMVMGGADPDDPLKMTQAATSLYGQSPESFEAAQRGGPFGGIEVPSVQDNTAPSGGAPSARPSGGPQPMANQYHIAELNPALAQARAQWEGEIVARAQRAGVDPHLALKVAEIESSYNPDAMSSKGYKGLFQLGTGAAQDTGVNRDNPISNIEGGIGYIKQMLEQNGGDPRLAMAAYNWGPENLKTKGIGAMPAETREYLAKLGLSGYVHQPQATPQGGMMAVGSQSAPAPAQTGGDQVMPTQAANQALIPVFAKGGKSARSAMGMEPIFADRINRMLNAMPPELRNQVAFNSGFRTFQEQKAIWDRTPVSRRHKFVAEPGHSNHEHGIALDTNMRSMSGELRDWLDKNEERFGLHRRMEYENWHFEPIEAKKDDRGWAQRVSEQMSHAPSAMETNPVSAEAASATMPEVDVTASAERPGYSIPGIPPGITDPRLERMIYASGLNPHGPNTFTGMMLKEAGDTVRTQIQHPGGAVAGGMFSGTGMDAQSANIVMQYHNMVRQGIQPPAELEQAYQIAKAKLYGPRTEIRNGPDGPMAVTINPAMPDFLNGVRAPSTGAVPTPAPSAVPAPSAPPSSVTTPGGGGVSVAPVGPRNPPKPETEAAQKTRMYGERMQHADAQLNTLGKPSASDSALLHGIGDHLSNGFLREGIQGMASDKGNKFDIAAQEFLNALLRKDTGATITEEEAKRYKDEYIPGWNDSPATVRAKAEHRRVAVEAMTTHPEWTTEQVHDYVIGRSPGAQLAPSTAGPPSQNQAQSAQTTNDEGDDGDYEDDPSEAASPQVQKILDRYGIK